MAVSYKDAVFGCHRPQEEYSGAGVGDARLDSSGMKVEWDSAVVFVQCKLPDALTQN